jgi:branched-subunit amino acid permease
MADYLLDKFSEFFSQLPRKYKYLLLAIIIVTIIAIIVHLIGLDFLIMLPIFVMVVMFLVSDAVYYLGNRTY